MMISILHLTWIIPVSMLFGLILAALMSANGRNDNDRR